MTSYYERPMCPFSGTRCYEITCRFYKEDQCLIEEVLTTYFSKENLQTIKKQLYKITTPLD